MGNTTCQSANGLHLMGLAQLGFQVGFFCLGLYSIRHVPNGGYPDRPAAMRKDMVEIIAAHNIPYAASTSVGYPLDLMEKVQKAAAVRGPSYIHCHCPCPTGWGVDTKDVVNVARLAVETGCVVLYEYEDGERRLSKKVRKRKPVEEYLRWQGRFRHILNDPDAIAEIQRGVDEGFEALMARMAA